MKMTAMALIALVSMQLKAATLNIPEFSIAVDGNRYTDFSNFEFSGNLGGFKSGGFMYWEYKSEKQEIVDLGNRRFLFKPASYSRFALTGDTQLRYILNFDRKNSPNTYSSLFHKSYSAQTLEATGGQELINLSRETLFVTTFPTADKLKLKVNTFIAGKEERLDTNCKREIGCILEINIAISSLEEKFSRSAGTKIRLYDTPENKSSENEFLEYSPLIPNPTTGNYIQPLVARAGLVKPEGLRSTIGVWLRYKGKGYYIRTSEHEIKDLDNIDLTNHYGQLTLTFTESHKIEGQK